MDPIERGRRVSPVTLTFMASVSWTFT